MGMGSAPGMLVTLQAEEVKRAVNKEFDSFIEALEASEASIDSFAEFLRVTDTQLDFDEIEEEELKEEGIEETVAEELYTSIDCARKIIKSWQKLRQSFEHKTGIELFLSYIDPERVDRYDDVSGAVFNFRFNKVFRPTTKAESVMKMFDVDFQLSLFTEFG